MIVAGGDHKLPICQEICDWIDNLPRISGICV